MNGHRVRFRRLEIDARGRPFSEPARRSETRNCRLRFETRRRPDVTHRFRVKTVSRKPAHFRSRSVFGNSFQRYHRLHTPGNSVIVGNEHMRRIALGIGIPFVSAGGQERGSRYGRRGERLNRSEARSEIPGGKGSKGPLDRHWRPERNRPLRHRQVNLTKNVFPLTGRKTDSRDRRRGAYGIRIDDDLGNVRERERRKMTPGHIRSVEPIYQKRRSDRNFENVFRRESTVRDLLVRPRPAFRARFENRFRRSFPLADEIVAAGRVFGKLPN